ncbi:threonine--tRNA ligase [bacterium]
MSEKKAKLDVLRHSTSHIMADAVKRLFPNVKLAIGPSIENGFYYDFDKKEPFQPDDLIKIESEMKKIIKENSKFEVIEKTKSEAVEYYKNLGEIYKLEILDDITDDKVTFYKHGGFMDMCRGPHIMRTGNAKHFALLSIAGAYWRGDEKNKMLQRIYATAFPTKQELDEHLTMLEEAKKRDHRLLGKQLDLFSIQELAGGGLVYWHPKGALVRKIIEDFWKDEHLKSGYDLTITPHIAKVDLWKTSGHWDFYKENMFAPMDVENQQYIVKPMNCPGHILIYKSKKHSYKELPFRWAELGTVYRFERSGVLHGLMRVRGFTQDDAHIFCRLDQLENEVVSVIQFVIRMLKTFGFSEYEIFLSTRPEKYVGTLDNWKKAEDALRKGLEHVGLDYEIDPGEGVFYGPKIDIKIKDSIGRLWQCSTIQVDFALPERFGVGYVGDDGQEHRSIMIHRALLGSLERFFGVLLEHYKGAFPVWLAPEQVRVMAVTNKQDEYAQMVQTKLQENGVRCGIDIGSEKLGAKIRAGQLDKIPYMIIVGAKEVENNQISIRTRKGENLPVSDLDEFASQIKNEIRQKAIS